MSVKLRKRQRESGNYSLYLDVYHKGKRHYEFLNLFLTNDRLGNKEILKLAESIRAKRQLELQNDEYGFISSHKKEANFVDYFEKIVNERPPDRSSWHCTLKKLKKFTSGYIRFSDIDENWLKDLQSLFLKEVSQNTAWHYYSNIKYALNRAVKEKIINSNPTSFVKNIKKPDVKREYLSLDEIKILINADCANNEVKQAFLFSCFTGLRFSDVRKLKFSDIKDNTIDYRQKKTKSLEYLPLSQTALNILKERIPNSSDDVEKLIFNLPTLSRVAFHVKHWTKKAKINKRITFHCARHTFATLSISHGVDLYTVSKLLGHKDIQTTQVYAKIIDSKKQEAVDKLPIIEVSY